MARTAAGGRPVSVRKRGKRFTAEKGFSDGAGDYRRYSASGATEPQAILDVALTIYRAGFISQALEIAGWVRSAWPSEPIPEIFGMTSAPVRAADTQKHLIAPLLDQFLVDRETQVSQGVFQRDKGKIKNHIKPGIGHLYLEDLNRRTLERFFYDLKQKPKKKPYYDPKLQRMVDPAPGEKLLGPSPLRDIHVVLNKFFKWCIEDGFIADSPLAGVKREARDGRTALVDRSEAFLVFDKVLPDLSDAESRQFLLGFLGLRQGERLGLTRDSVIRDGDTVYLDVSQQLSRETLTLGRLKTDTSARRFAVPRSIGFFLLELVQWRENIGEMEPGDTLVCRPDGRPLRHQADTASWHKVLESRGYPRYRQHLLRHWAATRLAKMGVSEAQARGFLGHSDALMTRYYTERDAVTMGRAITGLADDLLPDLAYLNRDGAPDIDAVLHRDSSAYVDQLLSSAAEKMGAARLVDWRQTTDFEHQITLKSDRERVTYEGVIPAGIDPAQLFELITESWRVVERVNAQIDDDLEELG